MMRLHGWMQVGLLGGIMAGAVGAAENRSPAEYAKSAQNAFRTGDYKQSAKLLQKAVKLDPANPDLRDDLGKSYERQAEAASFPLILTAKARQSFLRALALQPDHAGAIKDLVELSQQPIGLCEGNLNEASELIDRLKTVDADAAQREREYWEDAKQDESRSGQIALCAPVKVSRAVAHHFVPASKIPPMIAPKSGVAVAEAQQPVAIETEGESAEVNIGAGLN